MSYEPKNFLCPECGSQEAEGTIYVSTMPNEKDPWSCVLQHMRCRKCHCVIPAHLGERWDNLSVEAAQTEWKEIYRASRPR